MGSYISCYPFCFRGLDFVLTRDMDTGGEGPDYLFVIRVPKGECPYDAAARGNPVHFRPEDIPALLKALRKQTPFYRKAKLSRYLFLKCLRDLARDTTENGRWETYVRPPRNPSLPEPGLSGDRARTK